MTETNPDSGAPAAEGAIPGEGARGRKIIRLKEVIARVGGSRTRTWRKARDPDDDFPAPVQLGGNLIGWFEDEIDHWIATRPRVSWAPQKSKPTPHAAEAEPGHDPQPGRAA